ncbi:MAG: hypothetical protein GXO18_08510 [Aquificae bacterium]|nr:hypothetical protein [Aquificota bacterium]
MVKYASYTKNKLKDYFKSIQSIGADYIFLADKNNHPCITSRVEDVRRRWGVPSREKIVIVVKEIESWYLAGADGNKLNILVPENTEAINKEEFDMRIPSRFKSRIDFMQEILKNFRVEEACRRNQSFSYLLEKLK